MARPAKPAGEKGDSNLALTMTRVFDAPPAAVFRAWTDGAEIGRWIGPRSVKAVTKSMEAKPGGRYEIAMHQESGKISTVRGVYREVRSAERLVFTWAWDDETGKPGPEMLVTITFRALGKQTEMTLRHERFPSKEARDSHNTGWTGSFDKLAEMLAGKPGRA